MCIPPDLFRRVVETRCEILGLEDEHALRVLSVVWLGKAGHIRPAPARRQFDLYLLLGPAERKKKGENQKGAGLMLTNITPLAVVVIVFSEKPDSTKRIGQLVCCSGAESFRDQELQDSIVWYLASLTGFISLWRGWKLKELIGQLPMLTPGKLLNGRARQS